MNNSNTDDTQNNKVLHKSDKQYTTSTSHRVYPFVDSLVDSLYEQCDKLIDEHIQLESEKSIFMMFVIMYFAIHLKIKNNVFVMPEEQRKQVIKQILTEFIRNPEKRSLCIHHFESQFRNMFKDNDLSLLPNNITSTIQKKTGPMEYIDFESTTKP